MLTQRRPSPAIELTSETTGCPAEAIWRPAWSSDQIPEFIDWILFAEQRNARSTTNAAT